MSDRQPPINDPLSSDGFDPLSTRLWSEKDSRSHVGPFEATRIDYDSPNESPRIEEPPQSAKNSAEELARWLSRNDVTNGSLDIHRATSDGTADALLKRLTREGEITPYQADQLRKSRGSKLLLGNYILLERLGGGGMGEVFKARHRFMKRYVALKMLRSQSSLDEHAVKRFLREVRVLANLNHKNIVPAYDAGEHEGTLYLVMEYLPGIDLGARVRSVGPLTLSEACESVIQAADGLGYAHAAGVVHRDVKPTNLFREESGAIRILDLGLAKFEHDSMTEGAEEVTATRDVLGTADFMSPEQTEDLRNVDFRTDIYSLGCTLFYLLTARVPFERKSAVKKLLAHRSDPFPDIREIVPELPPEFTRLLRRWTAKRPEDRPASMKEAADTLRPYLIDLESMRKILRNRAKPLPEINEDELLSTPELEKDRPPTQKLKLRLPPQEPPKD